MGRWIGGFLVTGMVLAAAGGCSLSTTKNLSLPNQKDVAITSCGPDGNSEAMASGSLFNDHPSSADYWITVDFYQHGKLIGTADDGGLTNTNNEAPYAHATWFATLKPAPPGRLTCKLASVQRTDLGQLGPAPTSATTPPPGPTTTSISHSTSTSNANKLSWIDATTSLTGCTPSAVTGTLTNTGTATNTYIITVSDDSGSFELGEGNTQVTNIPPGRTATWSVPVTFSNPPTGPVSCMVIDVLANY